jgi:hypothetical protein
MGTNGFSSFKNEISAQLLKSINCATITQVVKEERPLPEKDNYIARELVFRAERKLLSFDRPKMVFHTGYAI